MGRLAWAQSCTPKSLAAVPLSTAPHSPTGTVNCARGSCTLGAAAGGQLPKLGPEPFDLKHRGRGPTPLLFWVWSGNDAPVKRLVT